MDGPRHRWYFSTVRQARVVPFHRTKYGTELLVDAAWVRDMPTFIRATFEPHALSFHDILLVTRGRGRIELDGAEYPIAPGTAVFSRPGEVRRWSVKGLDGACLFFTEEFLASFFSDGRFLDRFAFFRGDRPSAAIRLGRREQRLFLQRFAAMQREIASMREDAQHALRAVLYEVLVLLNRWYAARHPGASASRVGSLVERFQALVERDHARCHRVSEYAAALGVSPGHLNALCRRQLAQSASARIHARLALEARRLLLYTDLNVAEVADRLGFSDPAYFSRFFRRQAGEAPARYRASARLAGA
jgi:AraC family transcriptional regulator, transcriptional activator of pobA